MAYKWTIEEVDRVEMPMIHVMLEQMGQLPPHASMLAAHLIRLTLQFVLPRQLMTAQQAIVL